MPLLVLVPLQALVVLPVLNTDTLVLTFETGEDSRNAGGCSDDRHWPSAELGVLGPPPAPPAAAAAAAAATAVTGVSGEPGAFSRPRAPARARSKAACC